MNYCLTLAISGLLLVINLSTISASVLSRIPMRKRIDDSILKTASYRNRRNSPETDFDNVNTKNRERVLIGKIRQEFEKTKSLQLNKCLNRRRGHRKQELTIKELLRCIKSHVPHN